MQDEATTAGLYAGTAAGLLEFLDYARSKGILARKTAEAYKSASSLVLSIDGEGWKAIDLRGIDLGDQLNRYIRLRGQKASPQTLATYRTRVSKALELYLEFLDNPAGFKGPSTRRQPSTASRRQPTVSSSASSSPPAMAPSKKSSQVEMLELVTYPFPLVSGGMAYLQLPRDLSTTDVNRLTAFLQSVAIDGGASLGEGEGAAT